MQNHKLKLIKLDCRVDNTFRITKVLLLQRIFSDFGILKVDGAASFSFIFERKLERPLDNAEVVIREALSKLTA